MKALSLLLASALTAMTLGTAAMAQDAANPATMTCAEFLAMDADGMAMASEAMNTASDMMAGDTTTGDALADDAMVGDAAAGDAMASDAMADDAMAGDEMASDTTTQIMAACKAHPDAKVTEALAM